MFTYFGDHVVLTKGPGLPSCYNMFYTVHHQREILARYGVTSIPDLESRIAKSIVEEHPAWEDLIVVENLTARLDELNAYLSRL